MRKKVFLIILLLLMAASLFGCKKKKQETEESSTTEAESTTEKEDTAEQILKRNPGVLVSWDGKAVMGSLEVLDFADFSWLKVEKTMSEDESQFLLNGSFGEEEAAFRLEVLLVSKNPELILDIDEEAEIYDMADFTADALKARNEQAVISKDTFGDLSWDWGTAASEDSENSGWSLYGYCTPEAGGNRSIFISVNVIPDGTEMAVPAETEKALEDWFKGLQFTENVKASYSENRVFWLKNVDAVLSATDADVLAISNLTLELDQADEEGAKLNISGISEENGIQMDAMLTLKENAAGEQKAAGFVINSSVEDGIYQLTADSEKASYVLMAAMLEEDADEADYKDFGAAVEKWLQSCMIQ